MLSESGNYFDISVNGDFSYNTLKVENIGNSPISISWSNSIAPDGWEIGFVAPPTYLEPRTEVDVELGIKPPVNQPANSNAFEVGVYATIDNGFESMQVVETYVIRVLETSECSISFDETLKPLLGVERDGSSSQDVTLTNVGNIPLTTTLEASTEASGWEITMSEDSIENLQPGESMDVAVTAKSNENTETGKKEIDFKCGADSVILELSVTNTKSQGGLFGIVSPAVGYSIVGVIVLLGAIVGYRIKRSAPKDYSGEELVAPDAHVIPDDGARMQNVMDSVVGQESLAGGSVSAEEIAQALATSMPSLPPAPPAVPMGRPPSKVPLGRPPAPVPMGRPPAAAPPPVAPPVVQNQGPPLPPGGLPPGWTMQQWQYYGHQWLAQQGQQ